MSAPDFIVDCTGCGRSFETHKGFLNHLPCGRRTVVDAVEILGCRTLYGGPHPPPEAQVCPHCGNRRPMSPCPHCGRP
jgi:hypothetical protein